MKLKQTDAYWRAKTELLPDEELLWVEQPQSRRLLSGRIPASSKSNKAALLGVIVGLQVLLVLGGAFFMVSSSSTTSTPSGTVTTSQGTPWIMIMVIVMGLLVGILGIAFMLFRVWRGKQTIYAITDRRVLTIHGDAVRSDGEQDIDFIERKMHRDGTGDIIFRREAQTGTAYYGGSVFAPQTNMVDVGLFGISDPHEVEELMLEVFRSGLYPRKRKHDEMNWEDTDGPLEEEPDTFVSEAS